jgi:histidine ammonia-lyase
MHSAPESAISPATHGYRGLAHGGINDVPVTLALDGESLTPAQLVDAGSRFNTRLVLTPEAWARVKRARAVVDDIVRSGRTVYGINTGFGKFASTIIARDDVEKLQLNLIRSHSAGVGHPLEPARVRRLLALRINVLAKGHSGIRPETVEQLLAAFNAGVVPFVPRKGTVGASGDLAPLSHLALGMLGEGKMASLTNLTWRPAADVLQELGLKPITLAAKEGLAMINGTQFISSLGCEALERARNIVRVADVVAAMTVEALLGTRTAFKPFIHAARNHPGQMESAARIRSMLDSPAYPSAIAGSHANCGRVQDAYSLRCAPQVHGVAVDTLRFVEGLLQRELNCATDNPLIFADQPKPEDQIVSGGNFHGEFPAKALDYLAIAVHEVGNISERRVERLNNPALSHLPAFLVSRGGLNSGFMIAHCTAAALVSESKVLCHPASVDSISTSAAQEDHVSMGGFAARKALEVVSNVETIVAIELMCACQGMEFHRPLKSTAPLEKVFELVRSVVPTWTDDRNVSEDITAVRTLIRNGSLWRVVEPFVDPAVRQDPQAINGPQSGALLPLATPQHIAAVNAVCKL